MRNCYMKLKIREKKFKRPNMRVVMVRFEENYSQVHCMYKETQIIPYSISFVKPMYLKTS